MNVPSTGKCFMKILQNDDAKITIDDKSLIDENFIQEEIDENDDVETKEVISNRSVQSNKVLIVELPSEEGHFNIQSSNQEIENDEIKRKQITDCVVQANKVLTEKLSLEDNPFSEELSNQEIPSDDSLECDELTYSQNQYGSIENVIITHEIANKRNLTELECAEKLGAELTPKASIVNILQEEKTYEFHQIKGENYKMLEVIGTHAQEHKNVEGIDFPTIIANNKSVCSIEKEDEYSVSNNIRKEADENEKLEMKSEFYENKVLDTEIDFVTPLNINYEMSEAADLHVLDVQNIVENDEATHFDRLIDDNVSICNIQKESEDRSVNDEAKQIILSKDNLEMTANEFYDNDILNVKTILYDECLEGNAVEIPRESVQNINDQFEFNLSNHEDQDEIQNNLIINDESFVSDITNEQEGLLVVPKECKGINNEEKTDESKYISGTILKIFLDTNRNENNFVKSDVLCSGSGNVYKKIDQTIKLLIESDNSEVECTHECSKNEIHNKPFYEILDRSEDLQCKPFEITKGTIQEIFVKKPKSQSMDFDLLKNKEHFKFDKESVIKLSESLGGIGELLRWDLNLKPWKEMLYTKPWKVEKPMKISEKNISDICVSKIFSPQHIKEKYNYVKYYDKHVHSEISNSMTVSKVISDIRKDMRSFVQTIDVLLENFNINNTLIHSGSQCVMKSDNCLMEISENDDQIEKNLNKPPQVQNDAEDNFNEMVYKSNMSDVIEKRATTLWCNESNVIEGTKVNRKDGKINSEHSEIVSNIAIEMNNFLMSSDECDNIKRKVNHGNKNSLKFDNSDCMYGDIVSQFENYKNIMEICDSKPTDHSLNMCSVNKTLKMETIQFNDCHDETCNEEEDLLEVCGNFAEAHVSQQLNSSKEDDICSVISKDDLQTDELYGGCDIDKKKVDNFETFEETSDSKQIDKSSHEFNATHSIMVENVDLDSEKSNESENFGKNNTIDCAIVNNNGRNTCTLEMQLTKENTQ